MRVEFIGIAAIGEPMAANLRNKRAPVFLSSAAQEVYRLLQLRGEGSRDLSVIAELWRSAPEAKA